MTRAERLAAALAGLNSGGQGEVVAGTASLATPVTKIAPEPVDRFEPMDGGASPIAARVLNWCRAYVDRGVTVAWLAWAFDLDVDDLAFAMNGGGR